MRLRLGAFSRYRPRALTVVVLLLVVSIIALANLSFDTGDFPQGFLYPVGNYGYKSYGWPLIWHRYIVFVGTYKDLSNSTVNWHYSAARLAANGAMWLAMLGAAAAICEWLLRRYQPRLCWSLRTMLAAVAIVAASCAWYVAARNRADMQEPLIAEITSRGGGVMFQRWGPKWLDLFGVEPLRRRIIGLEFTTDFGMAEEEHAAEEAFLKRIGQMSDLQYLFVETGAISPVRVIGGGLAAAGDGDKVDLAKRAPFRENVR